ncbi:MAG: diterpene synthase, partial [Chloroflexi bacterium]|nr:diterpene synthase [Chloroflexota bacterium]
WNEFRNLPSSAIADLMRAAGPKTCVFPINGTRRWFLLEHTGAAQSLDGYLEIAGRRHIEIYRMCFDHGVEPLLTPVFGPDILERGAAYLQVAVEGMERLVTHPDFVEFYTAYDVRVGFYGDYRRYLAETPHAYLSDLFDQIGAETRGRSGPRLYYGVFAQDAVQSTAELAVKYHAEHGQVPDKQTLVELYYGDILPPVGLFIGFEKFAAFDMPLLATGDEDLYFTVSPSPYISEAQLRAILYDHLFGRRAAEADYAELSADAWAQMRAFYEINRDKVFGIGEQHASGGFWYAATQVELPESSSETQ